MVTTLWTARTAPIAPSDSPRASGVITMNGSTRPTGAGTPVGTSMQLLPERERTVLVMTFFDDSNADEVARATGITAGNARVG